MVRLINIRIIKKARNEVRLTPREILLDALDNDGHLEDLFGVWPLSRCDVQQCFDEHAHIHGVMAGNRWKLALENTLE